MRGILCLVLLAIGIETSVSARTWTHASTGRKIEAELIKVEGGIASLKLANGRTGNIEVGLLSLDDQAYLQQLTTVEKVEATGEWPTFRGPNGDGISTDTNLLDQWPPDGPQRLWTFSNAGLGYSGIASSQGRLYTLGTRGEDLMVVCINASDGKEIWSSRFGTDDQHGYNVHWGHGPRSTPTISDRHLYVLGPKGTLACLTADDGTVVWSKHLIHDFQGEAGGWGFSESPLVDGDRVLVAPGGNEAGIVCLDKSDGSVIWRASDVRPGKAEYASIVPTTIHGKRQYIRLFQQELVGVSADDGSLLWKSDWSGKTAVIPTPIVEGNQVYITTGYGVGSKLVEIDSSFSASDVWSNKEMKNHHGGVIKVGDYLYGFSDSAGLICQDWHTGKMVWNEKSRYLIKGAVHVADGHLYALNEEDGSLTLATVSPDGFEEKGRLQLDPQSEQRNPKGKIWTHPVVIGGVLYLRDQELITAYAVSK